MSHRTHELTAYDCAASLAPQFDMLADELLTELSSEITHLSDWVDGRPFRLVEPWPFRHGPSGPLLTQDGRRLHGAAHSDPHPDQPTFDLIIANNGFPLSAIRCAGPLPPPLPLMSPIGCVVANTGALVLQSRGLAGIDPDEAAFNLVIHRRKPVGLLTAQDDTAVERWRRLADEHGCDVFVEQVDHEDCRHPTYWLIEVARRDLLGDLLALGDLVEWWSAALPTVGLGALSSRVAHDLLELADLPAPNFIGRGGDLILAPVCDDSPDDGLPTWVVGAVLGYWPPTSLAVMLNHGHRGTIIPSAGEPDLRLWRAVHSALLQPA